MINHLRFQYNFIFSLYFYFEWHAEKHVLGIVNLLTSLGRTWGLIPPSFEACLTLLLHGFVAKQFCFLLEWSLTYGAGRVSHTFFYL